MKQIIAQLTETINIFLQNSMNSLTGGSADWEWEIKTSLDDFIVNLISNQLQLIDDAFFESAERMRDYLSKDTRERTLTTTLGTITFNRRRYKRRDGKGYYYHIDKQLNLDKYERISKEVKVQLLKLISAHNLSYQKAADRFNLSKTVVYYLLNSLDLSSVTPTLQAKIECDYLHVIADEDHIALQEHRQIRKSKDSPKTNSHIIKHVTLFTGVKKVSKNRNALVNRVTLTPISSESSEAFCERVNHFIYHNYNVKDNIYAYGDGANWIKALATEINAPFILDKFHMQQALLRIGGGKKNKQLLSELRKLLDQNKKKEFFQLVDNTYKGIELSPFKQSQISYMKNQWKNYQRNFTIPKAQYCCAEGINSHYFSNRLSSRPKGFSKNNVHNLAFLLAQAYSHHKFIDGVRDLLPKPVKNNPTIKNENKYFAPITFPVIKFGLKTWQFKTLHSFTRFNL
jgi:Uncharacterised protein family (UPF0236)